MVPQCVIEATGDLLNYPKRFEAALFVLKKTANEAAKILGLPFYVCPLSSRVVNYKGMLTCLGLLRYFSRSAGGWVRVHCDACPQPLLHENVSSMMWSLVVFGYVASATNRNLLSDLLRSSFDFDVGQLMNLRIHKGWAAQVMKNLSRHKLVNLRIQTSKACIHFSNRECFTVLSSKHPSASLAFCWAGSHLFNRLFYMGWWPPGHVHRTKFLTFVGGLSLSVSLSLSLSSFSPPNDLMFRIHCKHSRDQTNESQLNATVRRTCAPPPATKRSRLPRSTHSKCACSCWLTIAHLVVPKTMMIRAWKNFSVRSHLRKKKKRTNPHTCEMHRNCTSSRETTRNPLCLWVANQKNRRDLKTHNFLCQHKNRKRIVDFPAQERRDRTCQRAIHQPLSPTDLIVDQTPGCFLQCCSLCRFLVVACLDRKILGHTLIQLARPPFLKILRGRNPQSSSRMFPSAQILHERNDFANRESCIFQNPCDSPIQRHTWSHLMLHLSIRGGVLPPHIPKITHMMASLLWTYPWSATHICKCPSRTEIVSASSLFWFSMSSHIARHPFRKRKHLLCGLDVLICLRKW